MAIRIPGKAVEGFIKRRPAVLVAAGLVVVVASWMATGVMGSSGDRAATDRTGPDRSQMAAADIAPDAGDDDARLFPVAVITREAEIRPAQLVINGSTEPSRTVEIRAEIEGRLVALDTYRGRRVETGDIIARIALYDREAQLAEARALLRQREIEYAASERLVEQEYRSETQHAAAKAQLDAARAVVEQMSSIVERTNIRAPFDGVIHGGHAELGDYVKAGEIVATILDLDPILVVGHATEMEVSALAVGKPGAAELVDGTTVEGTVTYVAARADPTTRTYRYEIEVPNPGHEIRAGLTARTIVEAGATAAHRIPSSALTLSSEGEIGVKTVDPNDVVRFHTIRIIADGPDGLWVDGLPQTTRIISAGQEFVTEGQRVRPIEADDEAAADLKARDAAVDTIAEEGSTIAPAGDEDRLQ